MKAALLTAALWAHGVAMASALTPGSAPVGPRSFASHTGPAAAAAAATAANTLTLIPGQVSAIDRVKGVATIAGRQVPLHGSHLQVFFERGGRATLADLRLGSRVRFALEPGTAASAATGAGGNEARRIVLMYIERAP